jgi:hypothetical protein
MSRGAIPKRKEVMKMDEVKEIIAEIIAKAKQLMLRDGYHAPMVFAKGTNGKVAVVLESFGNTAEERAKDMMYAGAMVADRHNVGELELVVLVNEAWMSKNVMPSQDPNRIEVLTISSLDTSTQEQYVTMFEVVRNPRGQIIDLKQGQHLESTRAKGVLLTAFQEGYQIVSPVLN